MTTLEILGLIAIVVLLGHLAMLAAAETVVLRVDVVRAMRLVEEEQPRSSSLLWLVERRAGVLNVLMVLTVSARILMAAIATLLGVSLVGGPGGVIGAVVVLVLLNVVLAEAVPRTVALRHLERVALAQAATLRGLVVLFDPLARLVVGLGRALVPRRHEVSGPYASDDELRALEIADEDEEQDEVEPEERAMILSIFELSDTIAREVMVPRVDMITVPADASLDDTVRIAIEHGASRIPVHDPDDSDVIVGIVYAKDLLRRVATESGKDWSDLVRRPTFVPETRRADDLLREMQAAAVHLAIVVDEYGDIVGLVTIEDILEEIVGEIVDEHDNEDPLIEELADGWRVDARLGVDDLNELLGVELPEEGWDTVGGLVFGTLGRVPRPNDAVELEGIRIGVERVQGRRISTVLVTRRESDRHHEH